MKLPLLFIPFLSYTHAQLPTCNAPYVRKEFRELIGPGNVLNVEGLTFIEGVQCVMNSTGTTGGSGWDDFTRSHATATAEAHGNSRFLPWHRLFLIHMEKAMSDCIGRQVNMPYWDGTLDSQAPETSVIWSFLGGQGQAAKGSAKGAANCVNEGPYAGMTFRYPTPGCLTRSFRDGDLPSPETVALFAASSQGNYEDYRSRMENTYHASVHVFVGGSMLDIMASPNDVVFFLHHAFVDKLYSDWQNTNVENTYAGDVTAVLSMHDVARVLGNRPVSQVLRTEDWCYSYSNGVTPLEAPEVPVPIVEEPPTDPSAIPITIINPDSVEIPLTVIGSAAIPIPNMIGSLLKRGFGSEKPESTVYQSLEKREVDHGSPQNKMTPSCEDRDDWYNVRRVQPIPEHYLSGMGMDVATVRKYEKVSNQFVEYMNTKEHVSECALVNSQSKVYRAVTDAEAAAKKLLYAGFAKQAMEDLALDL
jgi:hypothetical protein